MRKPPQLHLVLKQDMRFILMIGLCAASGFSCSDDVKIRTTSLQSTSEQRSNIKKAEDIPDTIYIPGSKVVYKTPVVSEGVSYPLIVAEPVTICSDITFYNANGALVKGKRECLLPEAKYVLSGISFGDNKAPISGTLTLPLADQVRTGNGTYGAGGTGTTPTLGNCTAANQSNCVAITPFLTMNLANAGTATSLTATNFNASIATNAAFEFWDALGTRHSVTGTSNISTGNIKSSVAIFGVTGQYPSSSYRLASNTAATDLTLFATQLTTDGAFEFFDSAGVKYTGSGDSDIANANVKNGVLFENLSVTGSVVPAGCTYSTQVSCQADAACKWSASACSIDPWNIRIGKTVAGTAGALKVNCRNAINSAQFNSDLIPPGNLYTTAGSALDWWDTVDNVSALPTQLPLGWTSATYCDHTDWTDVTPDGACDSAADDCMMKDKISGLYWSESYPVTGAAPATTGQDWSSAVQQCDNLIYGGYSDWRMPTQNEGYEAYTHSIKDVAYRGAGTIRPLGSTESNNDYFFRVNVNSFWSATSRGWGTSDAAWLLNFDNGYEVDSPSKATGALMTICIRP